MAKPGELAELIARLFKLEEATVRQQARELRDHGLMVKEKAGRGAGSMSARDAAHLLIAAAMTTSVKRSVECVHQYQSCRITNWRNSGTKWNLAFLPSAELSALPEDHSFVDLIEAVLVSFATGQWSTEYDSFEKARRNVGKLVMNFGLSGPIISASSTIIRVDGFDTRIPGKRPDGDSHRYGDPAEERIDYSFSANFSHETLIEIAILLRA